MYEYDEECLQAFLEQQGKLFDEPVADTQEEAEACLEDCMAAGGYCVWKKRAWM